MENNLKNNRIIIAIDGFSSTGKSTVAKQLANFLGYLYVDTGAMYRAVTLFAMQNGFVSEAGIEKGKLIDTLPNIKLHFEFCSEKQFAEIYLNGNNVEADIRHLEVAKHVSQVAAISEVRQKLVEQQQKMGQKKGIVMDGRDIGTVVFPQAELKIFMNASAHERAMRRFLELQSHNDNVTFEEVLENVQERDRIDTSRKDSPLIKADDAIELNNSKLSKEEQFEIILEMAKEKIHKLS